MSNDVKDFNESGLSSNPGEPAKSQAFHVNPSESSPAKRILKDVLYDLITHIPLVGWIIAGVLDFRFKLRNSAYNGKAVKDSIKTIRAGRNAKFGAKNTT